MFKLYAGQRLPQIHVVSTEAEYWSFVERFSGPRSVFEAQGEKHGEIDLHLAENIESLLVPLLGPWERSEKWFHNLDFYGDGVRSLLFRENDFPPQCIPQLQSLLCKDAAGFCIHIHICDKLSGDDIKTVGAVAIMRDRLVITKPLARTLTEHA